MFCQSVCFTNVSLNPRSSCEVQSAGRWARPNRNRLLGWEALAVADQLEVLAGKCAPTNPMDGFWLPAGGRNPGQATVGMDELILR